MDGNSFDAWTRRRFGLGVSGFAASLLGLQTLDDAAGKKNTHHHKYKDKKKKGKGPKCKKAGTGCKPQKRQCCGGLSCQVIPGFGGERCCVGSGAQCSQSQECCSGACVQGACSLAAGTTTTQRDHHHASGHDHHGSRDDHHGIPSLSEWTMPRRAKPGDLHNRRRLYVSGSRSE